jgi:hypothetical protein
MIVADYNQTILTLIIGTKNPAVVDVEGLVGEKGTVWQRRGEDARLWHPSGRGFQSPYRRERALDLVGLSCSCVFKISPISHSRTD